jgi:hypothetical protein
MSFVAGDYGAKLNGNRVSGAMLIRSEKYHEGEIRVLS